LRNQVAGRAFLGGHSYGGRQASLLAASQSGITEGLLLLSYPLHPPQRPTELRTAHFPSLLTSALFVHGSRDGFGTYEEIAAAAKLIPSKTEILEISGAGHELLTKRNAEELMNSVVRAFRTFYGL
jgi:predicted alpha/beta-hydrolase family hydrolase